MDALSTDLWQRLIALGLCTARDLRRSRVRVRRLSRDLPAFDSVWLDALVQVGRLTPFQARVLAASGPEGLCVGPLVLVDRLGSDGRLTSYTARRPPHVELLEVTLLHIDAVDQPAVLQRLRDQIATWSSLADPRIVRSTAAHLDCDQLAALAPWSPGRTLAELLVRRGRFPISVVVEIARQMSAALESLHRCGGLHGDLRLRNVRIDPRGRLQLLRPGLLAAMQPHVTIHARIPADCYDGVAPELIDTHASRSVASDLYACGCLWWQLLAGRPPFPGGDPLYKLAAHQSRDVDDVRCWRPETPPPLAELIVAMTRRDPAARPASAAELVRTLHRPAAAHCRRLKRFVAAFESAALTSSLDEARIRRAPNHAVATMILLLAGVAGLFWFGPRQDWLKSLQATSRPAVIDGTETASPRLPPLTEAAQTALPAAVPLPGQPAATAHAAPLIQPLPEPVAGVVRLTGPGPYAAADLAAVGPLTIAGDGLTPPRVIVGASPWRLSGTTVILQHIEVISTARASSSAGDPGLLSIVSQDLGIVDCRLEARPAGQDSGPIVRHGGFIHWRPIEERAATGGRIAMQQSMFLGDSDALVCAVAPRSVLVQRSLKTGRGIWLSLPAPIRSGRLPVAFCDCTFRGGDALVEGREFDAAPPDALLLTLERCLLDPHAEGGLLRIAAGSSPRPARGLQGVQVSGFETWLRQGAELAVATSPLGPATNLDATELSIEGVQFAELHFAGPVSRNPADARLAGDRKTGLSADRCGCPPEAFAAWEGGTYNSAGPSRSAALPAPVAPGQSDRPAR